MRPAILFVLLVLVGTAGAFQPFDHPYAQPEASFAPMDSTYGIDVLSYRLTNELTYPDTLLYSDTRITILVTAPVLYRIRLDFGGSTVESYEYEGRDVGDYIFDPSTRLIDCPLDSLTPAHAGDTLHVRIRTTTLTGSGFFIEHSRFLDPIMFTNSFPDTARNIFPCHDVMDDKALIESWKITYSEGDTLHPFVSCATGVLDSAFFDPEGRRYFNFYHHEYPIAPYLIAFYIAPYTVIEDTFHGVNDIPISWFLYPTDTGCVNRGFQRIDSVMSFYESLWGPYPFDRLNIAETQVYGGNGAMENQANISVGENIISGATTYNSVLWHEIAHQWFGDAVTIRDLRDVWLSEGTAQYHEALVGEYFDLADGRDDHYLSTYMAAVHQDYLAATPSEGRWPVYSPPSFFNSVATIYYKGASVHHTLRWELGDSLYFAGMRHYYDTYRYGNASSTDFRDAMESATGVDLHPFFNSWVFGLGWPELEIFYWTDSTAAEVDSMLHVSVVQLKPYRDWVGYDLKLPIEVFLNWADTLRDTLIIDSDTTRFRYRLTGPTSFIDFGMRVDPDNWYLKRVTLRQFELPGDTLDGVAPGGNDQASRPLCLLPNPTTDRVRVEWSPVPGTASWRILDSEGHPLRAGTASALAGGMELSGRALGLTSGVYFLDFSTTRGRSIERVVWIP